MSIYCDEKLFYYTLVGYNKGGSCHEWKGVMPMVSKTLKGIAACERLSSFRANVCVQHAYLGIADVFRQSQ